MEFGILGPIEARADGGPIDLGRPKQRALLAALLLRAGAAIPREALVDALWGEVPPASAVQSLQVYVHGLRKALGAERIETCGASYRIVLEPGELDLERFETLVGRAGRELGAGHADSSAGLLREALGLLHASMRGDLDTAARYQEEAIGLQRELGDRDGLAISLHNLGRSEIKRGRTEMAASLLAESIELALALGYREVIANCLQGCAELAAAAGDLERAARLSGTSLAIFDEIGIRLVGETEDDYLALRVTLAAGLDEQRVDELEAEGRAAPRDEAIAEALAGLS